ncbi:MAG TPA: hemerythrin domain-containing protein [Candidatus Eisenbacteria bacterium]|nr:hemerythrin domain-containing protein [Candidatus Eisenbacteria bacterium]
MTTHPDSKRGKSSGLFERLRRDHARVLGEIGALEANLLRHGRGGRLPAEVEAALPKALSLLEAEFASHMAAEDEILYPALIAAIPAASGSIEPLFSEHAELRQMLAKLVATLDEPVGVDRSEQLRVQIHDIADLLRLHLRKEESLVFQLAPQLLAPSEIAAVSARLAKLEKAVPKTQRTTMNRSKGDRR